MKILFLLAVLSVVSFIWLYRPGALEQAGNTAQQSGQERMVLGGELTKNSNEQAEDADFTALYPPGLDPLANNLLTERLVIEDFTGELLLSSEP